MIFCSVPALLLLLFFFRRWMFLSRVSMPAERDIVVANPSVRLSVIRWYCIEMHAHIVQLFPSLGRGMMNLVFEVCHDYKIQRGTPSAGALNTHAWGIFLTIFDQNRLLSRKRYEIGPRYGSLIGSHMGSRSIRVGFNNLNDFER